MIEFPKPLTLEWINGAEKLEEEVKNLEITVTNEVENRIHKVPAKERKEELASMNMDFKNAVSSFCQALKQQNVVQMEGSLSTICRLYYKLTGSRYPGLTGYWEASWGRRLPLDGQLDESIIDFSDQLQGC